MEDIIWITYRGRRIPIKTGMKGKFDKKKLDGIKDKKENEKRMAIAKDIAKEVYGIDEEKSPELLERKAKEILKYNEGEVLEKGEKTYTNSNGEIERSTESLQQWRDSLSNKSNNEDAKNYMRDQYKAFDKGDISGADLEKAKIDSGLSKKEIEEARDYTNARAKENNSRISENKSGKTTSQPVPSKKQGSEWLSEKDSKWLKEQGHEEKLNNIIKNFRPSGDIEKDEIRLGNIASDYFYDKAGIYNENIDSTATKWGHDKAVELNSWNNRNTYIKGDTIEYDTKYPLGLSENWKQGEILEVKNGWASHGDTSPDKIYKVRDSENGNIYEISAGAVSKKISNEADEIARSEMSKKEYESYKRSLDTTPGKAKVVGIKKGYEPFVYYSKEDIAKLNTVSDYEQYFISQGYSKATALKKAKEIIAQRKRN